MPVGLETYDESGRVLVSYTSRISRVLGRLENIGHSGYHVDDRLLTGSPHVFVVPMVREISESRIGVVAQAWVEGNVLHFAFAANNSNGIAYPADIIPCTLIYGVY